MGQVDKVWAPLGDFPVLVHSLSRLLPGADRTVLVVHPDKIARARAEILPSFSAVRIVPGGIERQESVRLGLAALPDVDLAAVHDAARPFATTDLLRTGVALLATADGAIPVEPVRDTVKEVDAAGAVRRTLDRSSLRAVQTPQIFRMSVLRSAHETAAAQGDRYTDDAALVEAAGGTVVCFPGLPGNFKITTPYDLYLAGLLARDGVLA
jgi:2-C-methyl-D-erythritol 4-phosphate cytidylyltransferase